MNTQIAATNVPSPRGFAGATLRLDIDDVEHRRRQAATLGVATGHGFGGLDTLMTLPHGLPVPLTSLTARQRAYVCGAPAGICTVTDGHVTRHATRPCQVVLAEVWSATPSRTALKSASRFAPFCARRVVVSRVPRRPADSLAATLLEFEFYGVGVVLEHGDGTVETLVESSPWRPRRHTPAAWWFTEAAYGQFLKQTGSAP